MAEPAIATPPTARDASFAAVAKKRWRAWLRAIHRDLGYLSVGFTLIYAISGIAQNHIEDWGDVSYTYRERTLPTTAIADGTPDAAAIAQVARAVAGQVTGAPTDTFRAGDEVRLRYGDGTEVTAIGATITIHERAQRVFLGAANWLHRARGKPAWRYVSDVYAIVLLYLSFSGLLLIKGKLGLRWRGTLLVLAGVSVPVLFVAFANDGKPTREVPTAATTPAPTPTSAPAPTPTPTPTPAVAPGGATLKPLPPDD